MTPRKRVTRINTGSVGSIPPRPTNKAMYQIYLGLGWIIGSTVTYLYLKSVYRGQSRSELDKAMVLPLSMAWPITLGIMLFCIHDERKKALAIAEHRKEVALMLRRQNEEALSERLEHRGF